MRECEYTKIQYCKEGFHEAGPRVAPTTHLGNCYGVASINRMPKNIGLFAKYRSLL